MGSLPVLGDRDPTDSVFGGESSFGEHKSVIEAKTFRPQSTLVETLGSAPQQYLHIVMPLMFSLVLI